MKVQRGYKTELDLNNKQKTACLKHTGAARFAYNWGLSQKKMAMENKTKNKEDEKARQFKPHQPTETVLKMERTHCVRKFTNCCE